MKNADMPANPTAMIDTHDLRNDGLDESGRYLISNGLTKREMLAMHALSSVLDMFNPYEQGNFDSSNYEDTAKHAVGLADALLEELDK